MKLLAVLVVVVVASVSGCCTCDCGSPTPREGAPDLSRAVEAAQRREIPPTVAAAR